MDDVVGRLHTKAISIAVVATGALTFQADVLAIKYAQEHYGVDGAVAGALSERYPNLHQAMPKVGGFRYLQSQGSVMATAVLFIGVKPLREFGYPEIRDFGREVLGALAGEAPHTGHVALTIHGA
jgi:hypothetical protein